MYPIYTSTQARCQVWVDKKKKKVASLVFCILHSLKLLICSLPRQMNMEPKTAGFKEADLHWFCNTVIPGSRTMPGTQYGILTLWLLP